MENVVSLFDIRNPLRPLEIYTCHDAYVTKFFPLHEQFYSADENGSVFRLSYFNSDIQNRVNFNHRQTLYDLDYNYDKDYFLILLENNILRMTEDIQFDNIEN